MNLVRVNGAGMRGAREAGGSRRAVSRYLYLLWWREWGGAVVWWA